jgi:hypothetical protein
LLKTREFFQLKGAASESLLERYAAAAAAERRRLLTDSIRPLPLPADAELASEPTAIESIEYFASAAELCRLIVALDRMAGRPGLAPVREALTENAGLRWDRTRWPLIAYKGGSEPGVLNVTWLLERDDGARFAVSIGWNDPERPIDRDRALAAAYALVKLLEEAKAH